MATEQELHYTLIQYLEAEGKTELANIIKQSKIVYDYQYEFSGIISYQRKMYVEIKTPIQFKSQLEHKYLREQLSKMCSEIYEDDENYAFWGIKIGVLAAKLTNVEFEQQTTIVIEDSIYQSFVNELNQLNIDALEKQYLYEACECAMRNNRLAASTMLGCATELLLINLCNSYHAYLLNNGTELEAKNFKDKVVNAKSAYNRLDEFEKRIDANTQVFKDFGFENPKLNFNFLDIIRQVRNQSGHPSGKTISENDLKTLFGSYQHFIKMAHDMIDKLPTK